METILRNKIAESLVTIFILDICKLMVIWFYKGVFCSHEGAVKLNSAIRNLAPHRPISGESYKTCMSRSCSNGVGHFSRMSHACH